MSNTYSIPSVAPMAGMVSTLRQLHVELREIVQAITTLASVDVSFFNKITPLEALEDLRCDLESIGDAVSGCASTAEAHCWPPAVFDLSRARVNGRPIRSLEIFEEAGYWRWRIVDDRGEVYVDGGNFMLREDCGADLSGVIDYGR